MKCSPLFLTKNIRLPADLSIKKRASTHVRISTKKTAISRIENHAEDMKLSTLEKFANALGKQLTISVA